MPSPRPIPDEIKKARGTLRADRTNANKPKPIAGKPKVPATLGRVGKKYWEYLVGVLHQMNMLTRSDETAIELTAKTYEEWHEAQLTLKREGQYFETINTQGAKVLKVHPAWQVQADASRRLRMMLQEFGLTPSSRGKVSANPEEVEDIEDLL